MGAVLTPAWRSRLAGMRWRAALEAGAVSKFKRRAVAKLGYRACFGSRRSAVRIRPARPSRWGGTARPGGSHLGSSDDLTRKGSSPLDELPRLGWVRIQ